MASLFSCSIFSGKIQTPDYTASQQYSEGKFRNQKDFNMNDSGTIARIAWRYMTEKRVDASPAGDIPLTQLNKEQLIAENKTGTALYRLGHSSILLATEGEFWLIDPVFSDRASPVQWMGPKRFHPVPINHDQLPEIKGVIISHDHYDHLDQTTIKQLSSIAEHFITPLGISQLMLDWGVDQQQIHELDWWQHVNIGKLKLTATPAQHFSGRGITGGNQTLWASWSIETPDQKIFYSGDTGYFEGFKKIGERLGPFDLTLIENGAYDQDWSEVHMKPEETLQAHIDVKGKALLPVHNGTFDLALHPWHEPFERISELADAAGVKLVTPETGERLDVSNMNGTSFWWRQLTTK